MNKLIGHCWFLCICLYFQHTFAIVDYCSINKFASNSTYMQFTKEVSSTEYTQKGRFKSLHCCLKGYRSIEWFKEGRPYPWPSDISNFIIYPASENQTIYAQETSISDTGNYTCIVRNDTHMYKTHIQLNVIDTLPDKPQTTFYPSDQYIERGRTARLFCEAFVGSVNLPDAHNSISWRRSKASDSIVSDDRVNIKIVERENEQILGAYLTIKDVQNEDFGEYICKVNNPDSFIEMKTQLLEKEYLSEIISNQIPWKKIIFIGIILVLLFIKIFFIYVRFGLPLRVYCKDRFGANKINDGKLNEILICCANGDEEFVKTSLLIPLEQTFNYLCICQTFPQTTNSWATQLQISANGSRHLIVVLTPNCFNDYQWNIVNISIALEQLLALKLHQNNITCIFLQPVPKQTAQNTKNANGQTVESMMRQIHTVTMNPNKNYSINSQFWWKLRLQLPPKWNFSEDKQSTNDVTVLNNKRLNFETNESLEILV